MTTLNNFVAKGLKLLTESNRYNLNQHLEQPGFRVLYVRLGTRFVKREMYFPVLDIANVEATVQGKGRFSALVENIRLRHPTLGIYVESVLSERFAKRLKKMGFEVADIPDTGLTVNMYLAPGKPFKPKRKR